MRLPSGKACSERAAGTGLPLGSPGLVSGSPEGDKVTHFYEEEPALLCRAGFRNGGFPPPGLFKTPALL